MYKIQVGAFRLKLNAEKQAAKIIEQLGIKTAIVKEDGYYKVQCGAFSNVANAPAKLIDKYKKEKIPALKGAYVQESFFIGAEYLPQLVSIKSKSEVIGDIIGLLQSPAKNVISALQSGGNTIHGVLQTLSER